MLFDINKSILPEIKKKNIGVLISGRGSNLLSLIHASKEVDSVFKVGCVIANCDAEGLKHAKKFDIPSFVVREKDCSDKIAFEKQMCDILQSFNVSLVCLAGFMKILSPFFVQHWEKRLINIHPSLLPSFKGLNAQKQALEAGVKISGCTVHFVDIGMDTGKIISQIAVSVLDGDDLESLSARILAAEHRCYPEAVNLLLGKSKTFCDVV